jgi:hypothetical protein
MAVTGLVSVKAQVAPRGANTVESGGDEKFERRSSSPQVPGTYSMMYFEVVILAS